MKCLECGIYPLIHSFSGCASVSSRLLSLVCVKCRVFSKEQLILTMFERPTNLKGVACFKKQTELYPCNCRSKSPTSWTFSFNRLSNSIVKIRTICLGLWCLWFIVRLFVYKIVKWQQKRDTFSILVNLHLTLTIIRSISPYPKETLLRESIFHQQLALQRSLSPGSLVESEYFHFPVM